MINADRLASDDWPMASYKFGPWVKARPESGPLLWRLRDAWAVLTEKAEAVCFTDPRTAATPTGAQADAERRGTE